MSKCPPGRRLHSQQDVCHPQQWRPGSGVYPSMHWAGEVCIPAWTGQGVRGRGCLPGACLARGCLPGGVCPGRCLPICPGGVCLGVSGQGVAAAYRWCCPGVCPGGSGPVVSAQGGLYRMTSARENITLPQLHCGR